jgi:hypothetical protein
MTDKTKLKENIVKPLKSVVVTKKVGYQVSKLGYGYYQLYLLTHIRLYLIGDPSSLFIKDRRTIYLL